MPIHSSELLSPRPDTVRNQSARRFREQETTLEHTNLSDYRLRPRPSRLLRARSYPRICDAGHCPLKAPEPAALAESLVPQIERKPSESYEWDYATNFPVTEARAYSPCRCPIGAGELEATCTTVTPQRSGAALRALDPEGPTDLSTTNSESQEALVDCPRRR